MNIEVNSSKVGFGKVGDEYMLLHIPTDDFITLDENARKIWEKLMAGTYQVEEIIQAHAQDNQLSEDVASYQVINFLDELRVLGFVSFEMEGSTSTPLIDVPLDTFSSEAQIINRNPSGRVFNQNQKLKDVLASNSNTVIDNLDPNLSLKELIGVTSNVKLGKTILVHRGVDPEATIEELRKVPSGTNSKVTVLANFRETITLGEVFSVASATTFSAARARVIIIVTGDGTIIIVSGDIIIIIVGGGPGPSRGKSRSACKTMCV